jgi:hypothetical protein
MTTPSDLEPSGDQQADGRAEGPAPAMPVIREAEKVPGMPYPLLDGIPRTIGWQWRPAGKGGPVFAIITRGGMGGLKVQERFPLTEDGWRSAWHSLARSDPAAAGKVAARLAARAAEDAASRGGTAVLAPPPPPRFPSSAGTRRQILEAIARDNEKYARPFDRGKMALASLVGTDSWADYGNVVLQMAILDTLLSIEEKLGALLEIPQDDQPD